MLRDNRCRNWTFVGYPEESLKSDYRKLLNELHLTWIESPLHDDDTHGDGTTKKKHIHFILVFEGNKSKDQIYEIEEYIMIKKEGCTFPPPQPVRNMVGMCRYLIHLDDPDKAQYSKEDIFVSGGVDIETYFLPTKKQNNDTLKLMFEYIKGNNITSYKQFLMLCIDYNYDNWFYIATSTNTFALTSYFTSLRDNPDVKE